MDLSDVFGHHNLIMSLVTLALMMKTIAESVPRAAPISPVRYMDSKPVPPTAQASIGAERSAPHCLFASRLPPKMILATSPLLEQSSITGMPAVSQTTKHKVTNSFLDNFFIPRNRLTLCGKPIDMVKKMTGVARIPI